MGQLLLLDLYLPTLLLLNQVNSDVNVKNLIYQGFSVLICDTCPCSVLMSDTYPIKSTNVDLIGYVSYTKNKDTSLS